MAKYGFAALMAVTLIVSQACLLSGPSVGGPAVSLRTETPTPKVDVNALRAATAQAAHGRAIPSLTATITLTPSETLTALLPTITNTLVLADTNTPRPSNTPGPTATPAGAGLASQELVSLTSPVSPGEYATIMVKTSSGASCSIVVSYKSGPSKAEGLSPTVADANGMCSWGWKVGARTTPGTWSISVTTGEVTQRYPFVVE